MKPYVLKMVAVTVIAAAFLICCEASKTKQIIINSEPQGATIYVNGEVVGQTPLKRDVTFENKKKDRHLIVIKKKGYEPQQRYFYFRDDANVLFQLDKMD